MDLKHALRPVLKKKLLKKDLVHDYSFEKKKVKVKRESFKNKILN